MMLMMMIIVVVVKMMTIFSIVLKSEAQPVANSP